MTTIVERKAVNQNDFSFCFQSSDGKPTEHFRKWHESLEMIGKHYLVSSAALPNV